MNYLKIGELAKETGLKSTAIRYYERIGVFQKPSLNDSGYRQYDEKAVRTAKFIVHAKELGFSLKEIADLLSLRLNGKNSCKKVMALTAVKIADTDKKITALKKLKKKLTTLEKLCGSKKYDDSCPILEVLDEWSAQ